MMSIELQNSKLLLPSQLLNEKMTENSKPITKNNSFCFLSSSDLGSGFSSPIWSEFGSTESSEEDEHYYTADLVLQMAHSMLLDDEENEKPLGSTQSTLTSSLKPSTPPLKKINPNPNVGIPFQSRQALIDEQIRAIQITFKGQQTRKGEEAKNHQKNKRTHQNRWTTNNNMQRRNPSGMRAVYLGGSGSGTRCSSGTGVFLPRGNGNRCESRRKAGCAPVLIPAKVVQALNLHFNKPSIPTRSQTANNESKNMNTTRSTNHEDIGLPQEWTY